MEDSKNLEIVKKPNSLINHCHGFTTIHEQRMFYNLLLEVQKRMAFDNNLDCEYTLDANYIVGDEEKGGYQYNVLKKTAFDIMKKIINFPLYDENEKNKKSKNNFKAVSFVIMTEFKNGVLKARLNPYLLPYVEHALKDGYTKIFMFNALRIRSAYSLRIYELLLQYKNIGKREIELQTLREYLNIQDKLKEWDNFKRKVLNQAQKDIKKYTEIEFKFDIAKQGRKVHTIIFYIFDNADYKKPLEKKEKEIKTQQLSLFDENESSQDAIIPNDIQEILEEFVSEASKAEVLAYELDKIRFYANFARRNAKKNKKGFFFQAIKKDWGEYEKEKERLKKLKENRNRKAIEASKSQEEKWRDLIIEQIEKLDLKEFNEYLKREYLKYEPNEDFINFAKNYFQGELNLFLKNYFEELDDCELLNFYIEDFGNKKFEKYEEYSKIASKNFLNFLNIQTNSKNSLEYSQKFEKEIVNLLNNVDLGALNIFLIEKFKESAIDFDYFKFVLVNFNSYLLQFIQIKSNSENLISFFNDSANRKLFNENANKIKEQFSSFLIKLEKSGLIPTKNFYI